MQRTDSSRINDNDGYIKTYGFVFAESARVIVCFYLSLGWTMFYKFSLKTPQRVLITQCSASEPKVACPVGSTRAILKRHLADKMLDLPNFSMSI